MAQSLEQFHFNSVKFGSVCRQMAKEKHISQTSMAALTGLSYDTVGNIYAGKILKLPFEYFFKFCIVLETSLEVMTLLMIKGEDIDFRERILTYDTHKDEQIPVPVVLPSMTPGVATDAVIDTAVAIAAATPALEAAAAAVPEAIHAVTADDLQPVLDTVKSAYEARIADLKEQLASQHAANLTHAEQLHSLAMGILTHATQR